MNEWFPLERAIEDVRAEAHVVLDPDSNTYFLVVRGMLPRADIEVWLEPVVYIQRPEYWQFEVIGRYVGIGIQIPVPYVAIRSLENRLGTRGVTAEWADSVEEIVFPPEVPQLKG
ncbi:hypothetical protein [Nannocystis bainbridge]|uniref:Uncharacterized protein n=1 Tax=Nannocystis bainbridge TaxID=2995303 RepID=A0ABT5EDN6_9BACT|nr:hypothetical protein [Nannocystis bainbridge]MDC0723515.1 hypothetical protein [Nannocystis bainbridge]